jgi:dTDP-4-amino-4,6-dideoxygalactose transaminase
LTDEFIDKQCFYIDELNKINIKASQGGCGELYKEKCFGNNSMHMTNSQKLMTNSIMIPIDHTINDIEHYATLIFDVFNK